MSDSIAMYLCRFPLNISYSLSYSNVETYDTIIVKITRNGFIGFGEATFLPGYSDETPEDAFRKGKEIINSISHLAAIQSESNKYYSEYPFLVTAFNVAYEMIDEPISNIEYQIPIIALVNGNGHDEIHTEINNAISSGYDTIKTKITNGLSDEDLHRLEIITNINAGRLSIRVDANQSLDSFEIESIVKKLSNYDIALLEQPLAKNRVDAHKQLDSMLPFPVMLDESIYELSQAKHVVDNHITPLVKLKLQKCGSIKKCKEIISYLKSNDIDVVFGNGVQTDYNCALESLIFKACSLTLPGENIGYQKLEEPITNLQIETKSGVQSCQSDDITIRLREKSVTQNHIKEF